mmetsp:Transcript_29277/g.43161  ORF Transcript_29277/g.43161 Transcript_29277/m.43161 type:complete len:131 (+) Transcript_29277:725-1117(+)
MKKPSVHTGRANDGSKVRWRDLSWVSPREKEMNSLSTTLEICLVLLREQPSTTTEPRNTQVMPLGFNEDQSMSGGRILDPLMKILFLPLLCCFDEGRSDSSVLCCYESKQVCERVKKRRSLPSATSYEAF